MKNSIILAVVVLVLSVFTSCSNNEAELKKSVQELSARLDSTNKKVAQLEQKLTASPAVVPVPTVVLPDSILGTMECGLHGYGYQGGMDANGPSKDDFWEFALVKGTTYWEYVTDYVGNTPKSRTTFTIPVLEPTKENPCRWVSHAKGGKYEGYDIIAIPHGNAKNNVTLKLMKGGKVVKTFSPW